MKENTLNISTRQRRGRLVFIISLAVLAVALGAVFFILDLTKKEITFRKPEFDPRACVRLPAVSRVYRIQQSSIHPHNLWFGTAEGIRVLDLETFAWTRYGLDHGLLAETVSDICFAEDVPWVATWNGLQYFDSSQTRFIAPPFKRDMLGARVLALEYVANRGVYFYIDAKGLFLQEKNDTAPRRITVPGIPVADRITCIKKVDTTLYLGIEDRRLLAMDIQTGAFSERVFAWEKSPETLIWDILEHNGMLWVATSDDGVWTKGINDDTLRMHKDFPAKGAYIFSGEKDGFWCGTPFGLWRYHDNGDTWIQFVHPEADDPVDFQVFALANTPEMLWYGSMDLGAGYLTKKNVQWRPMRAGLSNPNVAAIAASDSIAWTAYGYQGGYLDKFTAKDLQYDRNYGSMAGIGDDHIQELVLCDSVLYYGSYRGFGFFDYTTRLFRHYKAEEKLPFGDITDIVCPDTGSLYLASLFGVLEFYPAADSFSAIKETEAYRITSLVYSGEILWCGTLAGGLLKVNCRERTIDTVLAEITSRVVGVCEFESRDGKPCLFAATKRNGCFIIDKSSLTVSPVGGMQKAGDHENHIMAMRKIDDTVWLGTRETGALIYTVRDESWKRLDYYDGLISDQVRSVYDTEQYIWIGCYGGLNRIDKKYAGKVLEMQ
ncbi:MAG: hypothetical protein GF350_03915 [Chitinivibrionales bacterium]|nr:hypothetical protein [Chitinivibrionales bacterium]